MSQLLCQDFLNFVGKSPSPRQVVSVVKETLVGAGYSQFRFGDAPTPIHERRKAFFIRGGLIVAIDRPPIKSGNVPMMIIAAHTDSPCFRLRPKSKLPASEGLTKVAVQPYGGGLWHTWFDRDLTLAGVIAVRQDDGTVVSDRSLHMDDRPVCSIPSVAIHLSRDQNKAFSPDMEKEMVPIAGLSGNGSDASSTHDEVVVDCIAKFTGIESSKIVDFDLCLVPFEKPTIGGLNSDFIYSARLDNLFSSFAAIKALCSTNETEPGYCRIVALFNNEEIGSRTSEGAFCDILKQLIGAHAIKLDSSAKNSFLISADVAHGVHPNYRQLYATNIDCKLGAGPVLKYDYNGSYITSMATGLVAKELAKLVQVPMQDAFNSNTNRAGSTVGPMLAASLGMRGIDLGAPIFAMHSIREMGAVKDLEYLVKFFEAALSRFTEAAGIFTSENE